MNKNKKYTKEWTIFYNYAGFSTAFIKGDTIEEAIKTLKNKYPSAEIISYEIYSEYA